MTESSALAIDNLNVHIGGQPVLTDVSLRVAPGEAVGLVGETGSGKTMTVRTATGLLHRLGGRITSGRVRVAGTDLTRGTDRDWRRVQGRTIALVPQSSMSSLDPLMSIGHQLGETVRALGGPTGGDRRAAVRGLLEAVQLTPDDRLLRAYPHELSGGMRQRVMIALALAGNPRILVADEPTTALDAAIRREILALLSSLRHSRGLGLLLVSHDLGSISATTDTTVVMYAGRTVEAGPTSEIFEQCGPPVHGSPAGGTARTHPARHADSRDRRSASAPRGGSCGLCVRGEVPRRRAGLSHHRAAHCVGLDHPDRRVPPAHFAGRTAAPEGARRMIRTPLRIQVEGLDHSFGHHQVLHDINLDVSMRREARHCR